MSHGTLKATWSKGKQKESYTFCFKTNGIHEYEMAKEPQDVKHQVGLNSTSVNPVHNAPVELPPTRSCYI
jgi:hypothetical protein